MSVTTNLSRSAWSADTQPVRSSAKARTGTLHPRDIDHYNARMQDTVLDMVVSTPMSAAIRQSSCARSSMVEKAVHAGLCVCRAGPTGLEIARERVARRRASGTACRSDCSR